MIIDTAYDIGGVVYTIQKGKTYGGVIYQIKTNAYNLGVDIYYSFRDITYGEIITALEVDLFLTPLESCQNFCTDLGVICP